MTEIKNNLPVIQVKGISKSFSGIYALKDIDIDIYAGKVNAIVGENGAGKSTLMKILSGVYHDYEGQIIYKGEEVKFSEPKEAQDRGISIIHQELNLIQQLSIAENIFLGREPQNKFGLVSYGEMNRIAKLQLDKLHLDVDPSTPVSQLRVGQQQLVEIARSLLLDCKVLIMDEPTSAISDKEVKLLFKIIKDLTSKGVAIIYISHKLNELFEIADCFVALRDGTVAGSKQMKDVSRDQIIQMMVGRKIKNNFQKEDVTGDNEVMKVENLTFSHPVRRGGFLLENISFNVKRGEVVGVFGLMGAGRSELLEAIFGLHPSLVSGEVWIEGKKVEIKTVKNAINAGIGLVPEDRKLQGLILNMNVASNTSLANVDKILTNGFLSKSKEAELSQIFIKKLKIKVSSKNQAVKNLSGGNQQKVVIAKWLATHPKVLLLDEPMRGVDIGAKDEIYNLIEELCRQGVCIIIVSSELTEILRISDKILVLCESRLTASMTRKEATEEKIMKAAIPAI
jgi:ribose transport system ATP-binding protein